MNTHCPLHKNAGEKVREDLNIYNYILCMVWGIIGLNAGHG